jgi:hypothetical protein
MPIGEFEACKVGGVDILIAVVYVIYLSSFLFTQLHISLKDNSHFMNFCTVS